MEILRYRSPILLVSLLWLLGLPCLAGEDLYESNQIILSEKIRIEGNRFFDIGRLLEEVDLKSNSSYRLDLLEEGIDRILTLYEENGFPYCQISPSHFRILEKGEISFSFLVEEGPQVKIREVQLEGLKVTKEKIILRELGTGIFGLFSQSRLNAGLKRVERLSYIKEIERSQLLAGESPEDGVLRITLAEKRNNTLSGVLGYAPSRGNGRGSLHGNLELVFDNIFGTGRMVRWKWSRKDSYSNQLCFRYREPWVLGLPPTLELSLDQLDFDSTYLQLSFSAKLLFNSTDRISWGVEGGWEKVVPGSAGETYLPDSRKYRLGAVFSFDLLDCPDNPRKGIFYQTEISCALKRNYPTSSFIPEDQRGALGRISLDLNHHLPTSRKQTIFVGLHFKGLSTDEEQVPVSDQFRLGGINSLRGYREAEFFGTQVIWTNLEYRFLLNRNSRFFLFCDYGYFQQEVLSGTDKALEKTTGGKWGYGFGLRIDSKAGLLGIDFGWGEGDSFSQGKIHLGVVNSF